MMLAAQTTAGGGGGHAVWHLLIVPIASVAVFAGLKAWEWWLPDADRHRRTAKTRPWSRPSSPLVFEVALASAGCSVTHVLAGPAHFHEATAFGLFFVAAAALQAAWALLVIRRADRLLLTIGAVGNAAVLALWAVTRTVGLPVGPETWHPEAVAPPDVLASLLEVTVVLGALWLLRHAPIANTRFFDRQPTETRSRVYRDPMPARSQSSATT
jgi:hypothetical protein